MQVREEVASCSERAYAKLPVAAAAKMLMLGSEAEVAEYAKKVRKRGANV